MRILHDKINSIQGARRLYRLMFRSLRPILVTWACSRCDEQVVSLLTKKKKKRTKIQNRLLNMNIICIVNSAILFDE